MNILKWIIFIVGGLAFLITVIFAVMVFMTEPKTPEKKPAAKTTNVKKGTKTQSISDQLNLEIENLKKQIAKKDSTIDSLRLVTNVIPIQEKKIEKLETELNTKSDKNARAKDMAKTFASMSSKKISPILNKLDDETVMLIYQQTSKTSRKDILTALDEARAAKITKKIINQN